MMPKHKTYFAFDIKNANELSPISLTSLEK